MLKSNDYGHSQRPDIEILELDIGIGLPMRMT